MACQKINPGPVHSSSVLCSSVVEYSAYSKTKNVSSCLHSSLAASHIHQEPQVEVVNQKS